MKFTHLILIALLASGLGACKDTNDNQAAAPAAHPATSEAPAHADALQPIQQMSGTVLETMDTAGYTYIKVKTADAEVWAAAPQFPVTVGASVMIPEGMPMPNYHSNTLNRDFDLVYFVGDVLVVGADMNLHSPEDGHVDMGKMGDMADAAMGHQKPAAAVVEIDFSNLTKAEKGYTIAEIFAQKDALATKEVTLRAKVVKFSPKIMKTNWIHLQDGSGEAGTHDLTITTDGQAAVGDTVVVKGILDLNQDFGYGYKYDVIIQKAEVTVE
ncbi:MAG: hypothetical protein J7K75_04115 [Desulfuromonas sp.]|nr:hypothetical protein [Desulfuromonas sp.]